jgi:hypothetical protein
VIEGLDVRPATNQLYAVGYNGATGQTQVYTVNVSTGVATAVGPAVTLATNMGRLAVDFNPQVDRIRVVGSTGMNYRLNPNDGTLTATDTPISYAAGDVRSGAQPAINAVAYNNNFAGTTSTVIYYYDFNTDNLAATLPPTSPNTGMINTVGTTSISTLSGVDLDIITNQTTGFNTGFLTASVTTGSTGFYLIDLPSGEARLVGTIGSGAVLTEMAIGLVDVALPVTLTRFAVRKVGQTSELTWSTQNEVNSDYYIIERSSDGRMFAPVSGKINSKANNGNSIVELNYFFTDNAPFKGVNYYRLLQTDKDGSVRYSNILNVVFDGRYNITVYPNPVKTTLNINGFLPESSNLSLKITDGSGKVVALRDQKNQRGNWNTQIEMRNFSAGVYYLQISDGTNVLHNQSVYKN